MKSPKIARWFVFLLSFLPRLYANAAPAEIWVCAPGEMMVNLAANDDQWPVVRKKLTGVKLYIDPLNKASIEDLKKLSDWIQHNKLKVAIELGGFDPMKGNQAGEWIAAEEIQKLEKWNSVHGRVDVLHVDGPIRRLLGLDPKKKHSPFQTAVDAAPEFFKYSDIMQKHFPGVKVAWLINFPNWGWKGDVDYFGRGEHRMGFGDGAQTISAINEKNLENGKKAFCEIALDCPQDYLMGEKLHPSGNPIPEKKIPFIERILDVEKQCRENGYAFSMIINSEKGGETSDRLFFEKSLQMHDFLKQNKVTPDCYYIQSWYKYPLSIYPESAPVSLMSLVKKVMEREQTPDLR